MSRPRKWLDCVSPDALVSEAAQIGVRHRLGAVNHYLPLAAYEAADDVEYVHQLRVSTRRAQAALMMFSGALPRKKTRAFRKALKGIRFAASEAREIDVMRAHLKTEYGDQDGIRQALKFLAKRREAAQRPLQRVAVKHQFLGPQGLLRRYANRVHWRGEGPEPRWHDVARLQLNRLAVAFDDAADHVQQHAQTKENWDALQIDRVHQFRIRGKRLRYALELSVAVLDRDVQVLYTELQQIQKVLGDLNDRAVASHLLRVWSKSATKGRSRKLLKFLARQERARFEECVERLPSWWEGERLQHFWQLWNDVVGGIRAEKKGA